MKTLKFKRESFGNYEATAVINNKTYTWVISSDGFYYWGITTYCNGGMISSDGWVGARKKMWVGVANREYNELLEGRFE